MLMALSLLAPWTAGLVLASRVSSAGRQHIIFWLLMYTTVMWPFVALSLLP